MISATLHLIVGVIMSIAAVFVYYKFRLKIKGGDSKENLLRKIAYFYVFFVGYNLSLSLPFFLSTDPKTMSLGYNLAIVLVSLACVPWWRIWFNILGLSEKNQKIFVALFLLISLSVATIQTFDLRLPTIDDSGFIIWHKNPVMAWVYAIMIALLTGGLSATFFKNWPQKLTFREKLKTFTIASGCFLYTLACIYFIPGNLVTTILAFIFFTAATIIFALSFFIPEPKKEEMAKINNQ